MDNRLWKSDQGDGTYRNAVLFADYSDPDVIRVGDTYYMTASSFNYTPGLPILTSKDLVNWRLVNYALKNIPEERYRIPRHSEGVWAPCIRYHEGLFHIYYGMPDEGIFVVRTADPLGKWDEPVCVLAGKGLIDPTPLWDEDGRTWLIHGYAKSRIGFKSVLGIFEMNAEGTKAVSEDHILYNGVATNPTIEGPKAEKRNGYYYIFAPAGGVKQGWQTVLRSRSLFGPFEEKVVLHQGNTVINGPHQGALVDTLSGEEWFLHFQDRGLYGRIVHLQPVHWEEGWPEMGANPQEGCGEPVLQYRKPDLPAQEMTYLEASDEFSGEELSLQWQWLGNHRDDFYSLERDPDRLRLYAKNPAGETNACLWREANVLTQKLVCPYFQADVTMHYENLREGDTAGFIVMGGNYVYLGVRRKDGKDRLILVHTAEIDTYHKKEEVTVLSENLTGNPISFRVIMEDTEAAEPYGTGKPSFELYYTDGDERIPVPTSFYPSDHTWVGAKLGLFAHTDLLMDGGSADFESFCVRAL
jgi:beta-xylosidase